MEKTNPHSIITTRQNPFGPTHRQQKNMGSQIHSVQSDVTADKVCFVYNAPNSAMIRELAEKRLFRQMQLAK